MQGPRPLPPLRPIVLQFASADGAETRSYRVADRLLLCDRSVSELEPFRSTETAPRPVRLQGVRRPPATAPVLYADRAWVGGHFVWVECLRSAEGFWLDVESAGSFLVTPDGQRIVELSLPRSPRRVGPLRPVDAMIGPCLCLAMALVGSFVLHASGSSRRDSRRDSQGDSQGGSRESSAVALLGLSGAGKSTLAAALGDGQQSGGGSWSRLADDILPVGFRDEGAVVLPRFPQLKLAAQQQWGRERDAEVPLQALFRLTAVHAAEPIRVHRLSGREAAVAIIRHTVAGRLFDAALSSTHLDFAGRLASEVPVYDLTVPRGLDTVPEVLAALEAVC